MSARNAGSSDDGMPKMGQTSASLDNKVRARDWSQEGVLDENVKEVSGPGAYLFMIVPILTLSDLIT